MKPAVKFITLSAARLSNKESLDTAIREGLELGAKNLGDDLALIALANPPTAPETVARKAA